MTEAYKIGYGGPDSQFWSMYGGRVYVTTGPVERWIDGVRYEMVTTMSNGRLVCDRLIIDRKDQDGNETGPPVNSAAIRAVNITQWLRSAVEFFVSEPVPGEPDKFTKRHVWPPEDFAKNGPTDEALDQMAQHYAWLQVHGYRPSGAFLEVYDIPRPTTSKWIAMARKKGILSDEHRREG
ncbi:hypothetical protein [Gordonia alkaliphila]|uniref:Uncharacterized protein n=1 Tax=Gordonia alkaliphila TaxID=1053547 RepID=A0ABP8ZGL7_9ACTN